MKMRENIKTNKLNNPEDFVKTLFAGIDLALLEAEDKKQQRIFRKNVWKLVNKILTEPKPSLRKKLIRGMKSAFFEALSNFPIITPIVTAALQTITSEDINDRLDKLIVFSKQTIDLQKETIDLQKENLQKSDEIIRISKEIIRLSKEIIKILNERLPLPKEGDLK
jgi:hypothetical protein